MRNDDIRKLHWDSTFFEKEIGTIATSDSLDTDTFLQRFHESAFDLVYVFTDTENQKLHTECIDTKITFTRHTSAIQTKATIAKKITKPVDGLIQLATECSRYSRFQKDERTRPLCNRLYELWIENALQGTYDDEVFAIQDSKNLHGFVTIKKRGEVAYIGLMAVHQDYQRQGIGKVLMETVEHWCQEQSLTHLNVITQAENIQACDFYKKCGFHITKKEYVYHLWKQLP